MPLDKVTLEVFNNYIRSIGEEMGYVLLRTAYSTFIKETQDFSIGLTTPQGEVVGYTKSIATDWYVCLNYGKTYAVIDKYDEGDICLTNDPYSSMFLATHTPDVHMWKPIFYKGQIVCFAVTHVHNTDVGGMVPASLSRNCTEIFQEGIRIPPQKIYRAGILNTDLLQVIKLNVRVPEQNWGDMKAQFSALNTGERKVHEIISKFGLDTFKEGLEDLLKYTEELTKAQIAEIPDGEYSFSDYLDEDAYSGMPCRISANMKVIKDQIYLDFSGSDPQAESSINVPTGGFEHHDLPMIALFHYFVTNNPSIPLNGGLARPIHLVLPPGTIMNPEYPAAVGMRTLTNLRTEDVVLGCLVQALPGKMPAAQAGGVSIMVLSTTDPKTRKRNVSTIEPMLGGSGGTPYHDGVDAAGGFMSALANTPVELNEAEVPFRILRYDLLPDSGGPGKFRGGLANVLEFQVFHPLSSVTARNRDRTKFQGWGVEGGKAGMSSRFTLNPGTAKERDLGNTDYVRLEPGDIIRIQTGGGGGYGNPLERDPAAVLQDSLCGFVSEMASREEYGVVIENDQVNLDATKKQRETLRSQRKLSLFDFGPEREKYEAIWSRAMYDALTEVLTSLPTAWRSLTKSRIYQEIQKLARERSVTPKDIYSFWEKMKTSDIM